MILRHVREPIDGQPTENAFEAIDGPSGNRIGMCTIFVHENEELFPSRPLRIYMEIEGDPAPDALLGASVARAKEIALQYSVPSRIFTQLEPDDAAGLASLNALGFKDNDGLVCMRRRLPVSPAVPMPIGCVLVKDDLDDPIEQKYFLERYNNLFNEEYDFEWLQDFRSHDGFCRLLVVAPTGMAGEAVIWNEGGIGKIGWLYTSRKWRRLGVAKYLLDKACSLFTEAGKVDAEAEIQARIPNMLHLMERAGFRQAKLVMRYPGIDMN